MNRFGRSILLALAGSASIAMVGCDWGSAGEGEDTWNDAYSWVNFTGVYTGTGGGALVSDFTSRTNPVPLPPVTVTEVTIATAAAGQSKYEGTLSPKGEGIVPGSVTIDAGVFSFTDDGLGVLVESSGKTGGIEYDTGHWSINLYGLWPTDGSAILGDWTYIPIDGPDPRPLPTRFGIYQFIVEQQGNNISFMDNNGSVYSGKLGRVSTTGGINQDNISSSRTPTAGTTVFGDYNVTGTSKVGKQVRMVGSLQGVVMGAGGSISLANRVLLGTWLEKDGKTGQINGEAAAVGINGGGATNAVAAVTL